MSPRGVRTAVARSAAAHRAAPAARSAPAPVPRADRRETWLIVALCALAAVRVFVFSAAFPFFNNIDEPHHVDLVLKYARGYWPGRSVEPYELATARMIHLYNAEEYLTGPAEPVRPPLAWRGPAPSERVVNVLAHRWVQMIPNTEGHAPPVYYVVAGAWLNIGEWLALGELRLLYWIRFLNAPLFALLVWCAYRFCRDWLPGRPEQRLGVPLLLAFFPQDVFYAVNSDVLSPLLSVVSLMLLLAWYRRDPPSPALSAATGLLVALTFLVKFTNVALPVVFGATLAFKTYRRWREGRGGPALGAAAVAALAALVPLAICLGRNYALLGDLLGTRDKVTMLGWSRQPLAAILAHPIFTPAGAWTFWSGLMARFWRGELVWRLRPIGSPAFDLFYALSSAVLLAAAGAAGLVARRRSGDAAAETAPADLVAWASVALSVLALIALSVSFDFGTSYYPSRAFPYFVSGRLIGGALVPFLVLYVSGLAFLVRPLSRVVGPLVIVAALAVAITVSEVALTRDIFANPYNWFHLR